MKFIKKLSMLCSMMFIGLLVSCGNTTNNNQGLSEGDNIETILVKHSSGETNVKKNPQRVVTFDFGSLICKFRWIERDKFWRN